MADRRDKQVVQRVFETSLSGLQKDPYLAQRVLNIAHGKGERIVKKNFSIGFIASLALIVVMLCSVAIAAVNKLDNNATTVNIVENDIVFEVKNMGNQIPHEEREKIFERFYRVDKSRNRTEKRYGLGLAIAKSTIEKYKGKIEVDYKDGFTIFKVIIPN